jgi:uncharacterized membrane protein YqiK
MFIAVPLSSITFLLVFSEIIMPIILVIMLLWAAIKYVFKTVTNEEFEASELKKLGIPLPERLKKYEDK